MTAKEDSIVQGNYETKLVLYDMPERQQLNTTGNQQGLRMNCPEKDHLSSVCGTGVLLG